MACCASLCIITPVSPILRYNEQSELVTILRFDVHVYHPSDAKGLGLGSANWTLKCYPILSSVCIIWREDPPRLRISASSCHSYVDI